MNKHVSSAGVRANYGRVPTGSLTPVWFPEATPYQLSLLPWTMLRIPTDDEGGVWMS